jgi:predicted Rossmann-fold nucleotide-binding protein
VPTPPRRPWTHDASPNEVESREELDEHLALGTLRRLTVLGLRLDQQPPDLTTVDVTDTLFVGCTFPDRESAADVVRRGASVVPVLPDVPYPTTPSRLYSAEDLAAGFASGGFEAMYDTVVFRHFTTRGGPLPDVREALAQRLHDAGIDSALGVMTATRDKRLIVGVMGGHAVVRGAPSYRLAASLARQLTRAGRLVATGGGPGVMEAANLGSFLAQQSEDHLASAIDRLAAAPNFLDHEPYTAAALAERERHPASGADDGGLAIPTWLYGHEPANLFAAAIAKYFSNAIREDTLLRVARGGVVFAPGWAGTVQEVFQAATKAFYRTDGDSGPLVFLDRLYWTETVPVASLLGPLLAAAPAGALRRLVFITDEVPEAVAVLTGG